MVSVMLVVVISTVYETVEEGLPAESVRSSTVIVPGVPTLRTHNQTLSRLLEAEAVTVREILWVVPYNPRHDFDPDKAIS